MFLGEYLPRMDIKRRLYLPKKIRENISTSQLILTRGYENCIFGWPIDVWQEINAQNLASPITDPQARFIRRYLFSAAISVDIDQLGRVIIPQNLFSHALISETAVLIGAGDHFEIWDKNKWEKYLENLSQQ